MNASRAHRSAFLGLALATALAFPVRAELRIRAGGAAITPASSSGAPNLPDEQQSFLRWKSGEFLYGRLEDATADTVRWNSPLFGEPVVIRATELETLEFPRKGAASAEEFAVRLRNGDLVYGGLAGIDAGQVRLRSERHGDIKLLRPGVTALRRLRGGRLLFASPDPGVAWEMKDDRNAPGRGALSPWRIGPGGLPTMNSWNRTNYLPLKLPEKVETEFQISAPASPRFRFDLNASAGASPSIETWDNTVVLTQDGKFVPLFELKPEDREVRLRLCWDRAARMARVFNESGDLLGELAEGSGPRRGLSEPGIHLRNTGLGLTLHSLIVREWNGVDPAKQKADQPHVLLIDGRTLGGKVVASEHDSLTIQAASGAKTPVKLAEVEAVFFGESARPEAAAAVTHEMILADGAYLSGRLLGIGDEAKPEAEVEKMALPPIRGVARMQVAWCAEPVAIRTDGVKLIRFELPSADSSPAQRPLQELDRLVAGKLSLHGTPVGAGDGTIRWQLPGAVSAVPLSGAGASAEIVRAPRPDLVIAPSSALFYLEGGEVLPGTWKGMDGNSIRLQSKLTELKELPAAGCKAMQFPGPKVDGTGFGDPGWVRVKGEARSVLVKDGVLTLSGGGAYGHPSMMQADEIGFSVNTQQGYGVLRLRFFTDDLKAQGRGIPILLMRSGDQLSCGVESENGNGFEDRGQFTAPYGKGVDLRFVIHEKSIEVMAGGISMQKLSAPPEKRHGLGLLIELANVWGNGERPMSVGGFSAHLDAERMWFPPVDTEARLQALMIPRFRRDDLPTHVLVAPNGDLLRGRIEAATAEQIRFRAGLETLDVPRDRVSAVIRLAPPDPAKPAAGQKPAAAAAAPAPVPSPPAPTAADGGSGIRHWLLLRDGGRLDVEVEKFEPDRIVGRSRNAGRCEVPMDLVHVIRFRPPPPTSAMAALESWKLQPMTEPVLPETGGQNSPLLGTEARDFQLKLLEGGDFHLAKEKGKVVVLDFWATWCGPCVKSLPELMAAMGEFDESRVRLLGVNQAEAAPVIRKFLDQRGWKLKVALDSAQSVGRQYGVEGIPHTVIVGPDGKIAWVKTGYDAGGAAEAAAIVRKLLGGATK